MENSPLLRLWLKIYSPILKEVVGNKNIAEMTLLEAGFAGHINELAELASNHE